MRSAGRLVFAASLAVAMLGRGTSSQIIQRAPLGTGTSAISGVVVDALTQKPVAGALVSLNPANPAGTDLSQLPPIGMRQIADDQGRFLFADLPATFGYSISVTRPGYFDGAYGRRGGPDIAGAARRITLLEGQWFRDARVELTPPSAINGTVRDESGDPMVGVAVRAYTEVYVAGVRHVASSSGVVTDDRGVYRLANLLPGRYIVAVPSVQQAVPAGLNDFELAGTTADAVAAAEAAGTPSLLRRDPTVAIDASTKLVLVPNSPPPVPSASGRPQVYPTTFYPASRTVTDAATVSLKAGEDRVAVDITIKPVPAVRIQGRLDGPADTIGGMTVRLLPVGSEDLGRGSEAATALTKADGSFVMVNVAAGAYTVFASRSVTEYTFRSPTGSSAPSPPTPPGAKFSSVSQSQVSSGPSGTFFLNYTYAGNARFQARQPLTVGNRDLNDVVVPMQSGISLSGRIEYETKSPAPRSMSFLSIPAEPANGDPTLGMPRSASQGSESGAVTTFSIQGLMPGAYVVRPMTSLAVKSVMWQGRDYADLPFDTTGGRDITDVVITFTDQTTAIAGTIRDQAGQPLPGAAFVVFPADRIRWSNYGLQPARLRSGLSSTTGSFTLAALPAGDYFLLAVTDDQASRWKDPAFLEAASRVATKVTLNWGDTRTQDLTLQVIR